MENFSQGPDSRSQLKIMGGKKRRLEKKPIWTTRIGIKLGK